MNQNTMQTPLDAQNGDGTEANHKRSRSATSASRGRATSGPNPQVNWRVEEDIKSEIEEMARRRGVSAGEIIKELWRSQHSDMLVVLKQILQLVTEQAAQREEAKSLPLSTENPPCVEVPSPVAKDPFVMQAPPPPPLTRSRWRRLWTR